MSGKQKAISSPKTFPVKRKESNWTVKPSPGPHSGEDCIPLGIVIRDVIGYADSISEVKEILQKGACEIDGRTIKDHRFPVGAFDNFKLGEEFYRLVPSSKGFELIETGEDECSKKLCRVEDKTVVKGGKTQLNLNDGKNLISENDEIETGDSVLVATPEMEIAEVVKMKEGNKAMIIQGKNRGVTADIKEKKILKGSKPNRIIVESEEGKIDLPEKLVFVIGEDEPVIKIK